MVVIMFVALQYALCFTLLPSVLLAATGSNCGKAIDGIRVRTPPIIIDNEGELTQTDNCWEAPPYAWNFGHWFVSYTSFPAYLNLWNFENDIYPQFPTTETEADQRANLDLTSYNFPPTGNSTIDNHIYTALGLDIPAPQYGSAVVNFSGQGDWHLTNYLMFLAWGYDTEGEAYTVQYETPVEVGGDGDISVISRKQGGPSQATTQAIFKALNKTFAHEQRGNLSTYAQNLQPTKRDARRNGEGLVPCDAACMGNLWMASA